MADEGRGKMDALKNRSWEDEKVRRLEVMWLGTREDGRRRTIGDGRIIEDQKLRRKNWVGWLIKLTGKKPNNESTQ